MMLKVGMEPELSEQLSKRLLKNSHLAAVGLKAVQGSRFKVRG